MKKVVITGGEGLIGTKLKEHFKDKFEVLSLDISLGHDLTNENFVKRFFEENKNLYGLIVLHAYNPLPLKNTTKIEPVDFIFFYVKTIRLCLELYLMNHVMSAWKITIRK